MILSKPFEKGDLIDFDCATGTISSITGTASKPNGNFDLVGQYNVAIYSKNNTLVLQIGANAWDLSSNEITIRYFHNVLKKITHFELEFEGKVTLLEYEAWWASIPDFEPIEPEMDEDEDFMGYVYAIWENKHLQKSLVDSWA